MAIMRWQGGHLFCPMRENFKSDFVYNSHENDNLLLISQMTYKSRYSTGYAMKYQKKRIFCGMRFAKLNYVSKA